jgi:hypothetical protein
VQQTGLDSAAPARNLSKAWRCGDLLKIPYSPWRSHIGNESKPQPACGSPEFRETKFADVRVEERSFGRKFKAQEDAARCSSFQAARRS